MDTTLLFAMTIALAALISSMAILIEHYLPWRLIMGRVLPRLVAYTIGTLTILVPYSILICAWSLLGLLAAPWVYMLALWVIAVSAGLATLFAWGLDDVLGLKVERRENKEREGHLRKVVTRESGDWHASA